jgi:hypothetical protein
MGRGPCIFLQSDVTRALKGAKRAGANVAGVKIERDGTIVVVLRGRFETDTAREPNERDVVLTAPVRLGDDCATLET